MQTDPRVLEPGPVLSSWKYLWEWVKLAFAGTKGVIGDAGLVLGLGVAWAHARWPSKVEGFVKRLIPATAGYEDSVAFAPVFVAGAYLAVRAVLAPLWLARRAQKDHEVARLRLESELTAERKASTETIESLQYRIAQLEAPAPRVLVRPTNDSQGPFALKNVGAVEAHNVKIRNLECGSEEYVEFDVIDPLEADAGEKVPAFRVMSRDWDNTNIFSITHFYSFTDAMPDESFYDLARRAGIPGNEETWTAQDFGRAMEVGPPRYALGVEYSDPSGRRHFETTYEWEKPWGSRDVVVHYLGWREITG